MENLIISEGMLTGYRGKPSAIRIPEGVVKIDRYAIYGDDTLLEASVPDSIEDIDETNFKECNNLKFNEFGGAYYLGNEKNPYLVLVSADKSITECEVREGCKIIMGKSFDGCEALARAVIPSSVKRIGFMAFYGCENLRELTFCEGVERVDGCAFYDCGFEKITLPGSLKRIERDAFCTVSLKEVTLPGRVGYIGCGAFTHNDIKFNEHGGGYYLGSKDNPYLCFMRPKDRGLGEISIHKDTKIIYSSAFMRCDSLVRAELPEGLLQIGEDAFRECSALSAVRLPESLEIIEDCAFADCPALSEVEFPGAVEIGSGAFMGCTALYELRLGSAVIGDNAFDSCEALERVVIGEGSNIYGDYIFSGCCSIREAVLPKSAARYSTEEQFSDSENVKIKYV